MDTPKLLRVASLPPFHIINKKETENAEEETSGFFEYSFAGIISQKLGLPYEILPSDEGFGNLQPDGNWSGMVGMLQRDEADIGIYVLSLTEERAGAIDFSYPYYIDRVVFATRNLERSADDESFLKPFSAGVWISVFASILLLSAVYLILFQRKLSIRHLPNAFESFFQISVNAPDNFSDGILRACWTIAEALLYWSYTAVLLSVLSIPSLSGVRNIPELANAIRQGKYMCTTFPGTSYADALINSADSNLKTIGECLKKNKGYDDFVAVLSELEFPLKPAYIGTDLFLGGMAQKYFISKDGFFPDYFAIGVKKDFCCKAQLDWAVHSIWASGIYIKLFEDFLRKEVSEVLWKSSEFDNKDKERSLSLADFEGVFLLLIAGYGISIAVFLIELLFGKTRLKPNADHRD